MSAPNLRKLQIADVPGAAPWFRPVITFLNGIVEAVNRSLGTGGVTFGVNIGTVKTLEVRTTASYGDPGGEFTLVKFPTGLVGRKAVGVLVLQAIDLDFPDAALSGSISCNGAWRESGGEILVSFVAGLEASHRYSLTFGVL